MVASSIISPRLDTAAAATLPSLLSWSVVTDRVRKNDGEGAVTDAAGCRVSVVGVKKLGKEAEQREEIFEERSGNSFGSGDGVRTD